jgi:thermitase
MMGRTFPCLAVAALLAGAAPDALLAQEASADFTAPVQPQVVPGEFIVKYRDDAALGRAAAALRQQPGVEVVDTLPSIGAQVIRLEPSADIGTMSRALSALPPVEYVEPVFLYHALVEPNDGQYSQQWAWPEISAPAGWDIQTDSKDVVVAVIDTGVDYNHEDLAGNMWRNPDEVPSNGIDDDGNGIVDDIHGANFVPTTPTGDPMDDNNHGTHVSGTIGALTHNTTGVAGTSWKPQIMALKFLSASGSGSTVGAIKAIEYAIAKNADIMSNSWGGGGFSQALEDAIQLANDQGILFTAAAGNNNKDNDQSPHYPSSYEAPNVLAVMATDRTNSKAGFSHYGTQSVDVGAPGVDILSTVRNDQYRQFSGTSMATPHVSGLAALLKQQDNTRDAAQLKQLIMDNVDQVAALQGLSVTGGRINLAKALGAQGAACQGGPAQVAYDEFFWPEKRTFNAVSNVLSVPFSLPQPMFVDVTVHGTARRVVGNGSTTFTTGVFTDAAPNVMWTGSYRQGTYTGNGVSIPVTSEFSIKLPAGDHVMYWKLWVSNADMEFASANITVRAFSCSAGGKLAVAQVAEAAPGGGQPALAAAGFAMEPAAGNDGNLAEERLTVEIDEATGASVTRLGGSAR